MVSKVMQQINEKHLAHCEGHQEKLPTKAQSGRCIHGFIWLALICIRHNKAIKLSSLAEFHESL